MHYTYTQHTNTLSKRRNVLVFVCKYESFEIKSFTKTNNTHVDTHNVDQSHAGTTLANLKKQRAQSRNSAVSENGSLIATPSITTATNSLCNTGSDMARNSLGPSTEMSFLSTSTNDLMHVGPSPTITKFSGVTSDVVSDSTRSRRCCVVM